MFLENLFPEQMVFFRKHKKHSNICGVLSFCYFFQEFLIVNEEWNLLFIVHRPRQWHYKRHSFSRWPLREEEVLSLTLASIREALDFGSKHGGKSLFDEATDPAKWNEIKTSELYAEERDVINAAAEKYRKTPISVLPYSLYKVFDKTGSRFEYENAYFDRRGRLNAFAGMSPLFGEKMISTHWRIFSDETENLTCLCLIGLFRVYRVKPYPILLYVNIKRQMIFEIFKPCRWYNQNGQEQIHVIVKVVELIRKLVL